MATRKSPLELLHSLRTLPARWMRAALSELAADAALLFSRRWHDLRPVRIVVPAKSQRRP